jgi:hypothetical protein
MVPFRFRSFLQFLHCVSGHLLSGLFARREMQRRMARGDHRLPKFSPGTITLYPSTPCGRAKPDTALGRPGHAAIFYSFGHPMPYTYGEMALQIAIN